MRVLIVGAGGREHALLWKLRRDAPEARFHATRPNAGMAAACEAVDLAPSDTLALADWAAARAVDLAVVGPEGPLAAGVVDAMARVGVPAFGPTAAAARIESDKAFAKDLMAKVGAPTARYEVHADADAAERCIEAFGAPVVVKASGLAAGKGALVCETEREAKDAARSLLAGRLGAAGERILVEEFMEGEELSCLYLVQGEEFAPLLPSQDHKRIGEGDAGPNTGGMGAYAPVGVATPALARQVAQRVVRPVLGELADRGTPFSGLLYVGVMIAADGPRVVEFNCRFGDPETQAVLPLMESSLLEPMRSIARGEGLGDGAPEFAPAACVATVLAAEGYPGPCAKGAPISTPELPPDVHCFHAGTALDRGRPVTAGGRVLAVAAVAADFEAARRASVDAARSISFEGKRFRADVGWRESERRRGRPGVGAPRRPPPTNQGA